MPESELSPEEQEHRRQAIAKLMPTTLFLKWMGVVFDRYEHDDVVLRVPFREELTNDGTYYHGGVIAAALRLVKPRFREGDQGLNRLTVRPVRGGRKEV